MRPTVHKEMAKKSNRRWFPRVDRACVLNATLCVLFAITAWFGILYIHVSTYTWQSTSLADLVAPIARHECSFGQQSSHRHTVTMKIGIVVIYDNAGGGWEDTLMSSVIENRQKYCSMHGYTLIVANNLVDRSRPAAWSKILAVEKYIGNFDFVLYMDMDIVIMNMTKRLEDFIFAFPFNQTDIIMTEDWNGPNTGVWLAKNSEWTKYFLRTAWDEGEKFIVKRAPNGTPFPFEYEQRVFHFLLNTKAWARRDLPVYEGDVNNIRQHIGILPQCAFNSYSLHPLDARGDREQSQYVDGDFLVHFAGKKGKIKTNLMKHFLSMASKYSSDKKL